MGTRGLNVLMKPQSIALVAPGPDFTPMASAIAENLRSGGFTGELFGAGPGCEPLESLGLCPDIEALPHAPDLAVICSDPDSVPELVSRLGAVGARSAVILASEEGRGGIERCGELRLAVEEAAEPYSMRLLGMSSFGVMVPGSSLNASLAHVQPRAGNLAFVTQSGGVLSSVLDWATTRNIGFSHLISLGTQVDLDFGDLLDYLSLDASAQAILLHVDQLVNVRKFMSAARLAARTKPVIVLRGGSHRDIAPGEPMGRVSAVGPDAVYAAAFRRAGLLRVSNIQELFDAVQTLARARSFPGNRLAILTNSRGVGVLAADALAETSGRMAELTPETLARLSACLPVCWSIRNPVDLQGDASAPLYAQTVQILLEDPGVDGLLVLHTPSAVSSGLEVARALVELLQSGPVRSKANRVLTCWLGGGVAAQARGDLVESGVLTYETPDEAVRGFMQVVRYRRSQEMLMETVPSIPEAFNPDTERVRRVIEGNLASGRTWLPEIDVRIILDAYGLRAQGTVRPQLPHELLVRVFVDERFGPVIVFGQGGGHADRIADQAVALPPLNLLLARELIGRTRIGRALETPSEAVPCPLDATALALVKVSQLICDVAEVVELDINPLVFDEQGITAQGARIRVETAQELGVGRLAIRPYPRELEERLRLPDGHSLLLRPIRGEDEPAYQKLFAALPPEDVFLRFMNPMKALPHVLAARLTQLDYDREMAFALVDDSRPGEPELCGGVRITADADNERAEFAILLRRDMTGLGLGPLMMRRIIEYARKRGIREIYGEVLSENVPMLRLCRALGFSMARIPDDPGVILATLRL